MKTKYTYRTRYTITTFYKVSKGRAKRIIKNHAKSLGKQIKKVTVNGKDYIEIGDNVDYTYFKNKKLVKVVYSDRNLF